MNPLQSLKIDIFIRSLHNWGFQTEMFCRLLMKMSILTTQICWRNSIYLESIVSRWVWKRHLEIIFSYFLMLLTSNLTRSNVVVAADHPDFARCPQPLPLTSPSPSTPMSSCELNKNTRRCHQQRLATHLSCRLYQTCDHAVLLSGTQRWLKELICMIWPIDVWNAGGILGLISCLRYAAPT